METLQNQDLRWALVRLPRQLRDMMKARPRQLVVAGGFIRACVAGERISDIDLFSPDKGTAAAAAAALAASFGGEPKRIIETENAFTVKMRPIPAQFIHRWTFESPEDIVPSFDFTIARAALWYEAPKQQGEDGTWRSVLDPRFYADLAAKRLVYCSPKRAEQAGGSMLRVLKFYQRGYRIPIDSLGAIIARLESGVDQEKIRVAVAHGVAREQSLAKVLTGLLHEVDPNVDPEHVAHLPADDDGPLGAD